MFYKRGRLYKNSGKGLRASYSTTLMHGKILNVKSQFFRTVRIEHIDRHIPLHQFQSEVRRVRKHIQFGIAIRIEKRSPVDQAALQKYIVF